jgi:hypothetical protein
MPARERRRNPGIAQLQPWEDVNLFEWGIGRGGDRRAAGRGRQRGPQPGRQHDPGLRVCPAPALRAAGIPVGLGTDGAASNDSQDLLAAVKTAALLQNVARLDPRALSAGDVLAMATLEGARGLGLDGLVRASRPLAAELVTRAGLGDLSRLARTGSSPARAPTAMPRYRGDAGHGGQAT